MKKYLFMIIAFFAILTVQSCEEYEIDPQTELSVDDQLSKEVKIKFDGRVLVTQSFKKAYDLVSKDEYVVYVNKVSEKAANASVQVDCEVIGYQATTGFCVGRMLL